MGTFYGSAMVLGTLLRRDTQSVAASSRQPPPPESAGPLVKRDVRDKRGTTRNAALAVVARHGSATVSGTIIDATV